MRTCRCQQVVLEDRIKYWEQQNANCHNIGPWPWRCRRKKVGSHPANESPLKIRIAIPLPRIFGLTGTAFLNSFTNATTHKESQDHAARRPPLSDISKYAPTFDTVVLPVYERLAKSHKRFHHTDSVAVARTLPNSLTSRVLIVSGCKKIQ